MYKRKKVRPNLKRLTDEEFKAISMVRSEQLKRMTDSEYREIWNYNPPTEKQTKK